MRKYLALALTLLIIGANIVSTAQEDDIAGIWQSIGYGLWFDVREDAVDIYQTTDVSCLHLVDVADVVYDAQSVNLQDVTIAGVGQFMGTFEYELTLEDGLLNFELGKVNPVQATRATALPETCADLTANTPENTFETFWHVFDENYPFFEIRGVDWQASYDQYRPMVTSETSDEELFGIFQDMLSPLGDGHVSINSELGSFSPIKLPDWLVEEEQIQDFVLAPANYLLDEPQFVANEGIFYGKLSETVGYLGILTFESSLRGDGDNNTLADEMSMILESFQELDAIVVDVRFNFGGEDTNGLFIAGHFIDEEYLISRKSVWFDDAFHPIMDVFVKPTANNPFGEDVYLLTSRMTISAAETFALAMSSLPNVTLVGEPTNGMLSDAWFGILPNGWLISLSNEQYLSVDGIQYEGIGVPPDVEVWITEKTFVDGRDMMLETVLGLTE